jgi:hypothetical protein
VARRALFPFLSLALCALSLSACSAEDGTEGEIQNGYFAYVCATARDPLCKADGGFGEAAPRAMPNTVAVGASFGVVFTATSSAAIDGSAIILPVSSELLASSQGSFPTFQALHPGLAGVIAKRGGAVVDAIHVRLVSIDHARIDVLDDASGGAVGNASVVNVPLGGDVTLGAAAMDAGDQVLAGSLDVAWTLDDAAVVEIVPPAAADVITLHGKAAGQTTLNVAVGDVTAQVIVAVLGSSAKAPGDAGDL